MELKCERVEQNGDMVVKVRYEGYEWEVKRTIWLLDNLVTEIRHTHPHVTLPQNPIQGELIPEIEENMRGLVGRMGSMGILQEMKAYREFIGLDSHLGTAKGAVTKRAEEPEREALVKFISFYKK